jgi:hypothetical protein
MLLFNIETNNYITNEVTSRKVNAMLLSLFEILESITLCKLDKNKMRQFLALFLLYHKNNKLQLLCRAHQLVSEGYKFFSNNKLVTVFSAPNYCGNCGNDGAVMKISDKLECSFIIIKPTNEIDKNIQNNNSNSRRNRIIDKIDY